MAKTAPFTSFRSALASVPTRTTICSLEFANGRRPPLPVTLATKLLSPRNRDSLKFTPLLDDAFVKPIKPTPPLLVKVGSVTLSNTPSPEAATMSYVPGSAEFQVRMNDDAGEVPVKR